MIELETTPETISTGLKGLDDILGVGGLPKGRVIEIFGPEATGKTTLALNIIAQCQAAKGAAAFIDAEHALDPAYAKSLGVNLDSLLVAQPNNGEQALEVAETLVRSGAVDLIVIDSVAALVPAAELDGSLGDTHIGLQARLMSQALRKITAITSKTRCMVLFINEVRQKVGVSFGNGEVTTGGNALKFYSSIRLQIRRTDTVLEGDIAVGAEIEIKVVKNKLAPPFRSMKTQIMYGQGFKEESK